MDAWCRGVCFRHGHPRRVGLVGAPAAAKRAESAGRAAVQAAWLRGEVERWTPGPLKPVLPVAGVAGFFRWLREGGFPLSWEGGCRSNPLIERFNLRRN